jgi:hypothetical protein
MTFVFRDIRWDSWRWRPILEKWGHLKVFISPSILKTATFLCVNDEPDSTVFFVRWALGGGLYAYYAVTTRHSLKNSIVAIRFNLKAGGTDDKWFLSTEWITHPSTDVGVLPLEFDLSAFDIQYIDIFNFADNKDYVLTPDVVGAGLPISPFIPWRGGLFGVPYGIGDEIFTIGLFEGHTGEQLTQPIARFGHIALNPAKGESVLASIEPPDLTPVDAFLVEMAVWKGQSGSPVFLRNTDQEKDQLPSVIFPRESKPTCLIGMVQGFYPGEQDVQINGHDATLSPFQMGIGIVIPAKDIRYTLMHKDLEKQRKQLEDKKRKNPKIRPSAASIKSEAAITKESFEDVLKRVSRKTSEPES